MVLNSYNGLNKEQLEAVSTTEGPLLIVAGAGTGKTKTLVSRVCYLIDHGAAPSGILLLTFTNAAAKEMQERAVKMGAAKIMATNFHKFCRQFLTVYGKLSGFSSFNIIDQKDAVSIISMARDIYRGEYKDFPLSKKILECYETSVNDMESLNITVKKYFNNHYDAVLKILDWFAKYKKEHQLMDFTDLLYFTEKILSENEILRKNMDRYYRYIMCDEYQDTNAIQDRILQLLSKDYNNLCVVGDDNQSIYRFRGARIENILQFPKRYPDCKVVKLVENYRSTQEILNVSNCVMRYAVEGIPKELKGQVHGTKPKLAILDNEFDSARYVVERITQMHETTPYKNMCVMVRNSMQSTFLESLLTGEGIDYVKHGGLKFFDREIVKNIFAFLRISCQPLDELAWYRILMLFKGIGTKTATAIATQASIGNTEKCPSELVQILEKLKNKDVKNQISYLLDGTYENLIKSAILRSKKNCTNKDEALEKLYRDIQDAGELVTLASRYKDTESFLADMVLEPVQKEKKGDYLHLSTIHSAKGLEYDHVFLLSPVQGIFPKTIKEDEEDPEELRCLYVALTRAKKTLEVIFPESVTVNRYPCLAKLSHHLDYSDVLNAFEFERPKKHY